MRSALVALARRPALRRRPERTSGSAQIGHVDTQLEVNAQAQAQAHALTSAHTQSYAWANQSLLSASAHWHLRRRCSRDAWRWLRHALRTDEAVGVGQAIGRGRRRCRWHGHACVGTVRVLDGALRLRERVPISLIPAYACPLSAQAHSHLAPSRLGSFPLSPFPPRPIPNFVGTVDGSGLRHFSRSRVPDGMGP